MKLSTPLGPLFVHTTGVQLTGLYFEGQRHAPVEPVEKSREDDLPLHVEIAEQIGGYFSGARARFDLPLLPQGTPFQQRVWAAIAAIPCGETFTYADLAQQIGQPKAVRAVGLATGRNPLCLVIPCHRVIGSNGRLTGYAGGLARKEWLLTHERRMRFGSVQASETRFALAA